MTKRVVIILRSWPDPIIQERLEDAGFFRDEEKEHAWICFCSLQDVKELAGWLKRERVSFEVKEAIGQGEKKRYPCLSDSLLVKGGPEECALCGTRGVPCREWIEGDDTDSIQYAKAARFYMCGKCVQERMQKHPRLYAPAPDRL